VPLRIGVPFRALRRVPGRVGLLLLLVVGVARVVVLARVFDELAQRVGDLPIPADRLG
jgi:hypothetical protein